MFKIGSFPIQTVGLLHALAFVVGVAWVFAQARKENSLKETQQILDLSVVIVIWAVLGARLFSVLFDGNLSWYFEHPEELFMFWHGGFTFYGGFIFATAAGMIYIRKHRMDLWHIGDWIAPALALGLVVGRLGCLASGDSFGKPTNLPWAVVFTDPQSLAPKGIPLHPTQIYSVVTNLVIFGVLIIWKKRQKFSGELFLLFMLLYALTRSLVEIFRDDPRGVYLAGIISTSQIISIAVAGLAATLYIKKKFRKTQRIPQK